MAGLIFARSRKPVVLPARLCAAALRTVRDARFFAKPRLLFLAFVREVFLFLLFVPLVLLDSNVEENPEYFRELTDQLYRSTNGWLKLCQRAILGMGGIKALAVLGYNVNKYHLNEGHAALAFVEKNLIVKARENVAKAAALEEAEEAP